MPSPSVKTDYYTYCMVFRTEHSEKWKSLKATPRGRPRPCFTGARAAAGGGAPRTSHALHHYARSGAPFALRPRPPDFDPAVGRSRCTRGRVDGPGKF
ncbi:hypothetical protein EVAR_89297_1 [Eumeta japonica]|uniref:Uncharacterized protein n=1 Tax=Eumeta variegata TaxID=151549 RepID=A0A4C1SM18_EUMVA|nr:hypothetical protein EVAR_89297_1 [Eumeta japonica]